MCAFIAAFVCRYFVAEVSPIQYGDKDCYLFTNFWGVGCAVASQLHIP